MISVLVADDHAVVRRGLVQIISETMDIEVDGEACSADEVYTMVRRSTYDVLVLDLNLGEASGLEVLKQLKVELPALPVLILSVYPENQFAVRTLRAGAAGYLNKDSAPEQLVEAIRRVADHKRYVSPAVAEELLFQLDTDSEGPLHETLSDREFQVLRQLASGMSVSAIAEQLSLSVKTVSTYRARVMEKMNMKSNAELTHYAIKNELIL